MRFRDLDLDDPDWRHAFPLLTQLRPTLTREEFDRIHAEARPQGLRYTAAFDHSGGCVALAGWRVVHNMSKGREFYVDEIVVDEAVRSVGIGAKLLATLEDRARTEGCAVVELDSGHHRTDSHRFYRREGYEDAARHFRKML